MRQYKFDKPLVESPFPPQDTRVLWVDVDEPTGKLLTIWEFEQENGYWAPMMIAEGKYMVVIHNFSPSFLKLYCDKGLASAGDIITVIAEPAEGYEAHIEVEWAGGDIELTEAGENTWTFEMPEGKVAVKGSAGKGEPVGKIILDTQFANPSINAISCTGETKVSSIYNGEPLVETYANLDSETLYIQADANTQIVISSAEITSCEIGQNTDYTKISIKNTSLPEFYCNDCYALNALYLSMNTALTHLDCSSCYALTTLDVSKNTALTEFYCNDCYVLTTLDVSKNTALTNLNCSGCTKLISISYPATNEDVSTEIADAITAATSTTGTVYTDNAAAYYSTIATAATTKGWTIEQLPE